jgi:nucleoside-diphosphate-sugar epimerase
VIDFVPRQPLEGYRVAVTGAAGFLGANLVAGLLAAGAEVTAIDADPGWRQPLLAGMARGGVDFVSTASRWPYQGFDPACLDGVDTVVHLGYARPDKR